ncbi:MAG: lipid A deacylase LpxR family protein [Gammaproteobacteria bacterium]|nr:lipid A deacylase LpxR family protein [Gammaproteobacteria bacterium]
MKKLLGACLLAAHGAAHSATALFDLADRQKRELTVYADNDLISPTNTDRYYTHGLRFELKYPGRKTDYSLIIGQAIYTPADLTLTADQQPADSWPYSAWLYLGVKKESRASGGQRHSYEINLGCVGPCARGEETQRAAHKLFNAVKSKGWDAQIAQVWGLQLNYRSQLRYRPTSLSSEVAYSPYYGAALGNIFVNAFAGAEFRSGTQRLDKNGREHTASDTIRSTLFFRVEARWVVHNTLLQGALWDDQSAHTVAIRHGVIESAVGFVWPMQTYAIGYKLVARSTEVRQHRWSLFRHSYGQIEFTTQF